MGVAQILRHLVDLHHRGALCGECGLLPGLGPELGQLVDRVTQIVGFAPRLRDARAMFRHCVLGGAARRPQPQHCDRIRLETPIGVEQLPMRRNIDHGAIVMLAVDLDQRAAERAQHLHAHRLVVDEGARAPIGELDAPQDQPVLRRDAVLAQQRERGMIRLDVEGGRDLPLRGALAHQGRVAAPAEREREGVEQDRLAGPGLAGEHRQAGRAIDIEPLDQDDIANRKTGEHGCDSRCKNRTRT